MENTKNNISNERYFMIKDMTDELLPMMPQWSDCKNKETIIESLLELINLPTEKKENEITRQLEYGILKRIFTKENRLRVKTLLSKMSFNNEDESIKSHEEIIFRLNLLIPDNLQFYKDFLDAKGGFSLLRQYYNEVNPRFIILKSIECRDYLKNYYAYKGIDISELFSEEIKLEPLVTEEVKLLELQHEEIKPETIKTLDNKTLNNLSTLTNAAISKIDNMVNDNHRKKQIIYQQEQHIINVTQELDFERLKSSNLASENKELKQQLESKNIKLEELTNTVEEQKLEIETLTKSKIELLKFCKNVIVSLGISDELQPTLDEIDKEITL